MEYPFNDEIFDHDNDEIFQNSQLETDSLWCNGLIDISDYDNQFFHDDNHFNDILTNNSNCTPLPHDTNQFSFETEDDNNNLQLSPTRVKAESTFDSRLYNSIQIQNGKEISKPESIYIQKLKEKSKPFLIDNLSQSKSTNLLEESQIQSPNDFINDNDDGDTISTLFSSHQEQEKYITEDNNRKNVFYINQASHNRKVKPTIYLTKRNLIPNGRKTISKIRRPENVPIYSIYQDAGDRYQTDRVKYSLSPSTSSPDSIMDCNLSVNGLQQSYNDDITSYTISDETPNRFYEMKYKVEKTNRDMMYSSKIPNTSRLFQSPIPQTGILLLTEEEKRTLILENYPIPTRLPLTKQEERNLKKVRRKIKNKISAQESRRKKKEYMEALEKKVEIYAHENNDLKKRLENQESLNKSLLGQLRHLQQMLGRAGSNTASTCLMVFLLCFSLILVGMPDRNQTMNPDESVLAVSNIHKLGYGSFGNNQKTQMTAMKRYFPPDLNGLLANLDTKLISQFNNDSLFVKIKDKGNEPTESIFAVNNVMMTNQRKGILLENSKEEEEECIQYGPKYLWWLLQSTNLNPFESKGISTVKMANSFEREEISLDKHNSTLLEIKQTNLINEIITISISQPSNTNLWSNNTEEQFKLSFISIAT